QPSLRAAPRPVPAGLGADKSPCPFFPPYLRAWLPRHYRICRPGSGAGAGAEPPVSAPRRDGPRAAARPRRHVSNFGETRPDPPLLPKPKKNKTKRRNKQESAEERRPGDNPGMGGTIRAEIPE
ncbi:hypothetical protein HGM15179_007357, partial [Zosterops borbonicus]